MKSILVTGGCGFIGSNFVRLLLQNSGALLSENGYDRLINLDALTYAGNRANLTEFEGSQPYLFVEGDICDQALVSSLLEENEVDTIVHFAAESHVDRSIDGPEPFVQTNVVGTLRLLMAAKDRWESIEGDRKDTFRFLHVSTDEVYGTWLRRILHFAKPHLTLPTARTPLQRPPVIFLCVLTFTLIACQWSPRIVPTIMALINSPKN